jgi:hypothetical protein
MLAQNSSVTSITAINLHDTGTDIKTPNLQGLSSVFGIFREGAWEFRGGIY